MADSTPRVPLYDRLPEIYRIKDAEQRPPGQLAAYLSLVEDVFGRLHENIAGLYDDLFIETCADWVIPYIGDLLGTSHLAGDPWTLRADVADTIALRRRKGTLAGLERLVFDLTRWGVHLVELRERLAWSQHLNHQRPDAGGLPPYGQPNVTLRTPVRGGTVSLRDPALLSLVGTPFDPFARIPDLRPPAPGAVRPNLPNLAVYLWRLADYRVRAAQPFRRGVHPTGAAVPAATHAVRFDAHPLCRTVRLFGTFTFEPDREPPVVAEVDETPGPIPRARLTESSEAGRPEKYVAVDPYDPANPALDALDIADVGLQFHIPNPPYATPDEDAWPGPGSLWTIRGADLCAWEAGLRPPLGAREIVIDPVNGRFVVGAASQAQADALDDGLLVTYTYGAVGPVGAHPIARESLSADPPPTVQTIHHADGPAAFRDALATAPTAAAPDAIELGDSRTYDLDVAALEAAMPGPDGLYLARPLTIRAADGERPVVRLSAPLRFGPVDPANARTVHLRLEGLFLTRADGYPADAPLIARAALNRLELVGCTLDPGGHHMLDATAEGTRAPIDVALDLREPYGFSDDADEDAFDQTPEVVLRRTVTGPLRIDRGYTLRITDSIVDAGAGVGEDPAGAPALTNASDFAGDYGPPTVVHNATFFGRVRVEHIQGRGGVFVQALDVLNNQRGCLKFSYFAPDDGLGPGNRLPQHVGCVTGDDARLRFTSETHGAPAYAQLDLTSDFRIRERGPGDDAMGAFNFLTEAHKWRNLQIRFREFMPVGVRPLLVPVT